MTAIKYTVESLTSLQHVTLTQNNPLTQIIRYKIQKMYNSLFSIEPRNHRSRRWDALGTAWKFIAGTPDAQDLQIINTTLNNLIDQNNKQFEINDKINHRIVQLHL